jgi:hypothetical protein
MLTPQPPLDMVVDKTAEWGITIVLGAIVAVALILSFIDWFRTGRPLVLSLMVSGGAIMVFEPMVDTVGGCWFPSNSWTAARDPTSASMSVGAPAGGAPRATIVR